MRPVSAFHTWLCAFLLAGLSISCGIHHGADISADLASMAVHNHRARLECQSSQHPLKKIAIDNVRVFDGYVLRTPRTVVIDGAVIGKDPTGAEHIDGNGGILLPGLIDAHCHPSNITHLQELGKSGVTTGFTMACFVPEMCTSLKNHRGLPDILVSSAPASAPGSAHGNLTSMIDSMLLVSSKSQVPSWVKRQIASNPDYIKIVAEMPGLDQESINLLVKEAHRYGKSVVCHAADLKSFEQAMMAQVDHIHHAPLDKVITPEVVQGILDRRQIVTPTLTMMRGVAANQPQTHSFQSALDSVSTLYKAGVPMLAGTDANLQPGVPAAVPFGTSMHDEMENLVAAGMSNVEALQAATLLPAKYFGLHDRGVIAPGMRADLVLIEGDPLKDIRATRNIKKVWLSGVEFAA